MTQILARAFAGAGHEVRVVGVYSHTYPSSDYEEDRSVRVWRLREPRVRFGWVAARRSLYRTVNQWARNGEIDLVEAPDSRGWFAGWPRMNVPLVLRSHGSYTYFRHELGQQPDRVLRWLETRSFHRADGWAAVSHYTADATRRVFSSGRRLGAILYNPIEVPKVEPDWERRVPGSVVFTGTLTAKKGVIPLVEAWPAVKARFPDAILDVLGKDGGSPRGGSMIDDLKARLPDGVRDSVRFRGHLQRPTLLSALSTARVAVFPSFAEAFAIAPLEAMSCGTPTVYSSRGSGPELIQHGEDGLLVDPDDRQSIADAIVALLTDESLAKRLGHAGYRRCGLEFSIERILPQNEEFYWETIRRFAAG